MVISPKPFKTAATINIDARTDLAQRHSAKVKVGEIRLITPQKTFNTKDINFGVNMTEDSLRSYINAGDMTMLLRTTGDMDMAIDKIEKIVTLAE